MRFPIIILHFTILPQIKELSKLDSIRCTIRSLFTSLISAERRCMLFSVQYLSDFAYSIKDLLYKLYISDQEKHYGES